MLLFANIMGHATMIYLCKAMEMVVLALDEEKALAKEYQQRASVAAEQIIHLAKALTEFHVFKASLKSSINFHCLLTSIQVHPFMPIPLILCAEFLYNSRTCHESHSLRLQELLEIFRQIKNVNDQGQSYIQILKMSCSLASEWLAKENTDS